MNHSIALESIVKILVVELFHLMFSVTVSLLCVKGLVMNMVLTVVSRFLVLSSGIVYGYYAVILKVDEEEFGGHAALLQEGLFASFSLFLVFYSSFNPAYFISLSFVLSYLSWGNPIIRCCVNCYFSCFQLAWTLVYSLAHF